MAAGWELIRKGLKIESPSALGLYLGCKHEESVRILPDTGKSVRVTQYNMEDFPPELGGQIPGAHRELGTCGRLLPAIHSQSPPRRTSPTSYDTIVTAQEVEDAERALAELLSAVGTPLPLLRGLSRMPRRYS